LFDSANRYVLKPVHPRFEHNEQTGDYFLSILESRAYSTDCEGVVLFSNVPRLKAGPVHVQPIHDEPPLDTVVGDPPYFELGATPGEPARINGLAGKRFRFEQAFGRGRNRIVLTKSARVHPDSLYDDWVDFTFTIRQGKRVQVLDSAAQTGYAGSIDYVGDFDRDGKLDILYGPHSDDPLDCEVWLFLSSEAGPNEIVHKSGSCPCTESN
jgi:hypothetical protein